MATLPKLLWIALAVMALGAGFTPVSILGVFGIAVLVAGLAIDLVALLRLPGGQPIGRTVAGSALVVAGSLLLALGLTMTPLSLMDANGRMSGLAHFSIWIAIDRKSSPWPWVEGLRERSFWERRSWSISLNRGGATPRDS